ncbi:OmpA family protein [Lewinella cohaerens]|uniref:OmpA family protein n=1 Tax=Lewinella cohaerens TaxID=70995 RepID=UPI00037D2C98|nr:OmpA family protein [Lewinella cohaerens]
MRFLAFLLFIAFVLFAIFARWFFICDILNLCEEAPVEVEVAPRLQTLQLTENDSVLLSGYDQFAFSKGIDQPELNTNNEQFLDTLAQMLTADTTKSLEITGRFTPQEKDIMAGFYENMGLARAAAIRDLMASRGIDENRISLKHAITSDSLLQEPLLFAFALNDLPSEYATASYRFTNMTYSDANFPSNSAIFDPGEAFRNYADSVKVYMEAHPEKSIRIVGHTDNIDSEKYNLKLGMRRAESAKEYLENLGITSAIETESKGETEHVASNDTPEGRQENRRVNFIIE